MSVERYFSCRLNHRLHYVRASSLLVLYVDHERQRMKMQNGGRRQWPSETGVGMTGLFLLVAVYRLVANGLV